MRKIYTVLIIIVVVVLIGSALRIAIPDNPNFNYICINVSATVNEKSSRGIEVTFYANATGGTHNFYINSSLPKDDFISNVPYGFGLFFVNNNSSFNARFSGRFLLKHQIRNLSSSIPDISTPAIHISKDHRRITEKINFTNIQSGYYFYYLGCFKSSGPTVNYVKVNYLDAKSAFNILNLTFLNNNT